MKKFAIAAVLLAAMSFAAVAQGIRLGSPFTDHMVLQRETQAPVWGWAKEGTLVTVAPSWEKTKYSCKAGEDGRWEVRIATPQAGGPYSISISAKGQKGKLVLQDVMSGEVWLCTGQSNMQMPVAGFDSQNLEGGTEAILDAPKFSRKIRIYNIFTDKAHEPLDTIPYKWELSNGEVVARTSAVAYFFAKRLNESLDIPVGIICSPWGGCLIEPWMTREYIDKAVKGKIPEERYQTILARKDTPGTPPAPTEVATMYNARMYPVKGYSLRGFLWYQGCSNLGDITYYDKLQASMVQCWRDMWGDAENKLPFMFVSIAPYSYGNSPDPIRGYFVENQLHSLDIIPNSYAAITESIGDEFRIHPAQKREISDQFATEALENIYGMKTGIGNGFPSPSVVTFPSYSSVEVGSTRQSGFQLDIVKSDKDDKTIVVQFRNSALGLGNRPDYGMATVIHGFEVAGPDKVFHPVPARAIYNTAILDCSEIPDPVAVRYAFHNYVESDLKTTFGVPVPSFRTDKW